MSKYYEEIRYWDRFTARDVQAKLKKKGLPWEKRKVSMAPLPISGFFPKSK